VILLAVDESHYKEMVLGVDHSSSRVSIEAGADGAKRQDLDLDNAVPKIESDAGHISPTVADHLLVGNNLVLISDLPMMSFVLMKHEGAQKMPVSNGNRNVGMV
jgi:hypothetical protein